MAFCIVFIIYKCSKASRKTFVNYLAVLCQVTASVSRFYFRVVKIFKVHSQVSWMTEDEATLL